MKTSKKFDRAMNPHDGSRRRLKSVEHEDKTEYKRKSLREFLEEEFPEFFYCPSSLHDQEE